jgi:hypothetical protein
MYKVSINLIVQSKTCLISHAKTPTRDSNMGWLRKIGVKTKRQRIERSNMIVMNLIRTECRSKWPRYLRNELSSLARTLGSWVRNPLKAWTSVLCAFNLCLCFSVCR